jgi:hypothetical protein
MTEGGQFDAIEGARFEERKAVSARDQRNTPIQLLKQVEQLQSPPQREGRPGEDLAGED